MPTIPPAFDPANYYPVDNGHIDRFKEHEFDIAAWPLIGARLIVSGTSEYVDPHEVQALNSNLFTAHRNFGYSVGQFHEFFIEAAPEHALLKFGNVEVTIGEVTPLGIYLYDKHFDKHYHGEWEFLHSVRIFGAPHEHAEIFLLNALSAYHIKTGIPLRLIELNIYEEYEHKSADFISDSYPPCSSEIDPTRFYFYGTQQPDHSSGFLYFYRVIEYFSFLNYQQNLSRLRRDDSISDRDFLKQTSALLSRDEKGPIIKLIQALVRQDVLHKAASYGLIERTDAGLLALNAYEFRNAVVHAKYDQRSAVFSESVIHGSNASKHWREIMMNLATDALRQLGPRISY